MFSVIRHVFSSSTPFNDLAILHPSCNLLPSKAAGCLRSSRNPSCDFHTYFRHRGLSKPTKIAKCCWNVGNPGNWGLRTKFKAAFETFEKWEPLRTWGICARLWLFSLQMLREMSRDVQQNWSGQNRNHAYIQYIYKCTNRTLSGLVHAFWCWKQLHRLHMHSPPRDTSTLKYLKINCAYLVATAPTSPTAPTPAVPLFRKENSQGYGREPICTSVPASCQIFCPSSMSFKILFSCSWILADKQN